MLNDLFSELNWMDAALDEAVLAKSKNCVPIGCVIIQNNQLIAKAHNADFWHAEILAIMKAQQLMGNYLENAKMFVTLEPCKMCRHAVKLARIPIVFYGAASHKTPSRRPRCEFVQGVKELECGNLIKEFFTKLRK